MSKWTPFKNMGSRMKERRENRRNNAELHRQELARKKQEEITNAIQGGGIVNSRYADESISGNTGLSVYNPSGYDLGLGGGDEIDQFKDTMKGRIDTSNIDFEDKDQVMQIQKSLIQQGLLPEIDPNTGRSNIDGVFGPNTEGAYQTAINQRRQGSGMDEYSYGSPSSNNNPLVSAADNDGVFGADNNLTFGDAAQQSVNLEPNYEGTSRNIVGDAIYEASGGDDAEWEDMSYLARIGQSLPGVGGNPTYGQFWRNMLGLNKDK